MTKNEYIASIMLEAADLLKEDSSDNNKALLKKVYDECVAKLKPLVNKEKGLSILEFDFNETDYNDLRKKGHVCESKILKWDYEYLYHPTGATRDNGKLVTKINDIIQEQTEKAYAIIKSVAHKYKVSVRFDGEKDFDGGFRLFKYI